MTAVRIQQADSGRLEIHGDLNFKSVALLWNGRGLDFPDTLQLDIDLSHVERSDSAGLALLLACIRRADETGKTIRFFNIPAQMLAIARVSSLDQVLPLHRD